LVGEPYVEPTERPEASPWPAAPADTKTAADGRPAPRPWVIGPVGTDADIPIDHPSIRPHHATVEVDRHGAWWVTAIEGDVYVDGEPVSSIKRDPGSRFTLGTHEMTVPDGAHRGHALSVECAGVTVRRGGRVLLDNVTLNIPAAEFVAVVADDASTQMLL